MEVSCSMSSMPPCFNNTLHVNTKNCAQISIRRSSKNCNRFLHVFNVFLPTIQKLFADPRDTLRIQHLEYVSAVRNLCIELDLHVASL